MAVTSPSATQQILLAQAYDQALQDVDYQLLVGKKVYLDATNIKLANAGWQAYRLREELCRRGVLLQTKPEEAELIVEASVAVNGTDAEMGSFGISMPAISQAASVLSSSSGSLVQSINQYATIRLSLFAYESKSRQFYWESGPIERVSWARATYAPFLPVFRSGTITTPAQATGRMCLRSGR